MPVTLSGCRIPSHVKLFPVSLKEREPESGSAWEGEATGCKVRRVVRCGAGLQWFSVVRSVLSHGSSAGTHASQEGLEKLSGSQDGL